MGPVDVRLQIHTSAILMHPLVVLFTEMLMLKMCVDVYNYI